MSILAFLRRLWHFLPSAWRYRFAKKTRGITEPIFAKMLPKADDRFNLSTSHVLIIGLFSSAIGHGMAATLLVRELEENGVQCDILDVSQHIDAPSDAIIQRVDTSAYALNQTAPTIILVVNPDIAVHILTQLGPAFLKGHRVIGYWVWELDEPPTAWSRLAELAHEIWTPSHFSARSLAKIFKQPIHIVPHPVALGPQKQLTQDMRTRARRAFSVGPETFVALQSFSFASSLTRKNAIGAIMAFSQAFDADDDACLILRYMSAAIYPEALLRLQTAASLAGPQVKLVSVSETPLSLSDFYAMSDVYISLHRSEGFGLNLAEAMRAGLPVIATAYSGNLDFMDDDNAALVGYSLNEVDDVDGIYTNAAAKWAHADISQASSYLKQFFNDRNSVTALQMRAKDAIKSKLSGGQAARLLRREGV